MGKQHGKSHYVRSSTSVPDHVEVPTFDEQTLSSLTKKIEFGLQNPASLKHDTQSKHDFLQDKSAETRARGSSKVQSGVKELGKMRKRDAQGKVKEPTIGRSKANRAAQDKEQNEHKDERDILLKEILALGGNEEDLDLVEDADSDEHDITGEPIKSQGFGSKFTEELSKFVADLGIRGQRMEVSSESESDDRKNDDFEEVSHKPPAPSHVSVKATLPKTDKILERASNSRNSLVSESLPLADWSLC